jgi:hypothetical protein
LRHGWASKYQRTVSLILAYVAGILMGFSAQTIISDVGPCQDGEADLRAEPHTSGAKKSLGEQTLERFGA